TPQLTVDDVPGPRVALPLRGGREHGVDVAEQAQRRAVTGAPQPRDEVRPRIGAPVQLDLQAGALQVARQVLLRLALVAWWVHRVEAHKALQDVRRLPLHRGQRYATACTAVDTATTSRIQAIARMSCASPSRPVSREPSSAPGIDAPAPTAATVQSGAAEGRWPIAPATP